MSISTAALIMRSMYFLFHCSAYPFSSQSAAIKSSCSQPPFYAAVFSPFNSPLVLPRGGADHIPNGHTPYRFLYIHDNLYTPHIQVLLSYATFELSIFSLFTNLSHFAMRILPCPVCGGLTAAKRPGAQPPGAFSLSKKSRRVRALRRLALPLGELSSQMTERALRLLPVRPLSSLSVLATLGHLSQGERQGVLSSSRKSRGGPRSLQMRAQRSGSHLSLSRILTPFLPVRPLSSLSVLAALGHLSQGERQGVLSSSKKPRGGPRSLQMRALSFELVTAAGVTPRPRRSETGRPHLPPCAAVCSCTSWHQRS